MKLIHSGEAPIVQRNASIAALLETITEQQLRGWVECIAVPRHFEAEPEQNQATADWLSEVFVSMGYHVERQDDFSNLVALPDRSQEKKAPSKSRQRLLVGAHYDSVPGCPGADDNGSAVAAMLGCAAACNLWEWPLPVVFVAFNREEDSLLGSRAFVASYLPQATFTVHCAHILEMVGYASPAPGSQRVPTGLPIKISDIGNFLGLLANSRSSDSMELAVRHAGAYVPDLPVTGLTVKLGLEQHLPVLARSDHVPFWAADLPAVMWTDTADFRNNNYHQPTDTPETLDYGFLRRVTQLLTASVMMEAQAVLS